MQQLLKSSVRRPKKSTNIIVKLDEAERKHIQSKANKFTRGNISEWVRYAAIHLEPKAADLTEDKEI